MFSQFRQAVESFAQPLPRQQDNASPVDVPSQSPDPLRQPSAQLVENARMNLRKSIAAQRNASPTQQNSRPRSVSPGPSPIPKNAGDPGLRKTTLEERLRASFATSEASGASAPKPCTSPQAVPVTQHPLSPTLTPLPDSPTLATNTTASALDTFVSESSQPKEHPDTIDSLGPSQENLDVIVQQNITTSTDPRSPTSSDIILSADSVHIDPVTDSNVDVTRAQEASQLTSLDAELNTKLCTESSGVVDASTVDSDASSTEDIKPEPEPMITDELNGVDVDVEALRERLRLVEKRFADISTPFKQIQIERRDIDDVITELTPLNGSRDVAALREYLTNVNMKMELSQDELQRLNGKLTRQDEQLEELRDIHRLEIASHSDQIGKLRQQLSEAEALITASQSTASQTQEDSAKRDSELGQLRAEVSKANETAREEEEKRVKAISLLKTVRQKLVKAEKDRDDALREVNEARERGSEEKEKDRAERANLEREVSAANAEREKIVTGLRAQFDKDMAAAKDRAERDIQAAKKQFEAETHALKTSYSVELSTKQSRISILEGTVSNLTGENRSFFEQLELRQAELESSQYHADSLQAQNTELQFQLKELQERVALLGDEIGELRGEHETRPPISGASAEEISQLVTSIESKYTAQLLGLKRTLATAEKERTEAEANWSRKLTEKAKETDELKRMAQSSALLRERDEDMTGALKAEIEKLHTEARYQHDQLHELQSRVDTLKDAESSLHQRLSGTAAQADDSLKQLEESKSREVQLRTQNKVLREELRKVQNSVAVLERQRNPGVGYWSSTSRSEATDSRTSISSTSDGPTSSPPAKNEEEINYEYLRNVIFQFLEHKEMRPNLVRVLSTILRFTPQETRRLMSKV